MAIKSKECNPVNYQKGRGSSIKYIVVHYTGNNGDTAKNNADYFARQPNLKVSAHYFVDEKEIWQSVPDSDTAWHCGGDRQSQSGGSFFGICANKNSIGIEMCNFMKYNEKVAENVIFLIKELMGRYSIPANHVIRHFDVTGKSCPAPLTGEKAWREFTSTLEGENLLTGADELMSKEYDELKAEIAKLKPAIFDYVDKNLPAWAKPTVEKLIAKEILKGDEDGKLGLTIELLRVLVINDRAGLYEGGSSSV